MFYFEKLDCLFIHVQRTGGTSIESLFTVANCNPIRLGHQHENAQSLPPEVFEKYDSAYKFAFVRNPWARIFSWYTLTSGKGQDLNLDDAADFQEFVAPYYGFTSSKDSALFFHFNQLDYFPRKASSEPDMDFIGRFERLQKGMKTVLAEFNLQHLELPFTNTGTSLDYRDFYDQKTKAFIAEKCAEDIACFGYTFDGENPS
jgi:hypothetical protein